MSGLYECLTMKCPVETERNECYALIREKSKLRLTTSHWALHTSSGSFVSSQKWSFGGPFVGDTAMAWPFEA